MEKSYHVKAVWDEDAGVFYAETDIPGLNVEASTLKEFIEIVEALAPEMMDANRPAGSKTGGGRKGQATLTSAAMELSYA